MDTLAFSFDEAAKRYRASQDAREVAFIEADRIGTDALLIKHTEAHEEGKGYASALLRHVLEEARATGRKVIPICPYAAAFMRKHPEYHDVLRPGYPL